MISAPSGAGKSTLIKRLMAASPGLRFSVSYTTRAPRATEKNGRDYFFVSPKVFERMVRRGEFVEWADVYGHLYGTAHKQLQAAQEAGQDILLDIDVQGHQQVRQRLPEAVSVFILPPSFQELSRRLRDRHSDAPEEIERRLETAREEIAHWAEYDYLVVNDHLTGCHPGAAGNCSSGAFPPPQPGGAGGENHRNIWRIMSNGNTTEPG